MTKAMWITAGSMRTLLALSLAGSVLLFVDRARGSNGEAPPPLEEKQEAPAFVSVNISFKLDPRLTRGLHMGDRWVSPPVYSLNQTGKSATVDTRVGGVDAAGRRVEIDPTWTPADPEMVTVTLTGRSEAKITVQRAGQSRLRVSADGVARVLSIKAVQRDGAMQVEIAQVPAAGTPGAEERARILAGQTETRSYALGVDFGRKLKQQPVEVDPDLLAQGLRDALGEGILLLTEEELQGALAMVQGQLRAREVREQADQRRELAEKNRKEGQAFLAENQNKEGVVTLESGLQYRVLTLGDGARPTMRDSVVCHYRGTFLDGTEFDSSYRREKPGTFPLRRVIKGWREALQLMPVGSKWQLFIPPNLGYGVRGTNGIGPNASLVFEVELLSINDTDRHSTR